MVFSWEDTIVPPMSVDQIKTYRAYMAKVCRKSERAYLQFTTGDVLTPCAHEKQLLFKEAIAAKKPPSGEGNGQVVHAF